MSARGMLIAMVGGSILVISLGARHDGPSPQAPRREPPHERAWLSREAAAQIIAPAGGLGPLFAGVVLGGPAPDAAVRERISAFARDNNAIIDFEIEDNQLRAVRLDVTYSGGAGYEGADVLALRVGRPSTGACCVCGPDTWVNDWVLATEDGAYVRARVNVNRVVVRWERAITTGELVDEAMALFGQHEAVLVGHEGWIQEYSASAELPTSSWRLEFPYRVDSVGHRPGENALRVEVKHGRIASIELDLYNDPAFYTGEQTEPTAAPLLRARWGKPRETKDGYGDALWTWRQRDRTITFAVDASRPLTIETHAHASERLALERESANEIAARYAY